MTRIMRAEKDPVPQHTGTVKYISSSEFDDVGATIVTTGVGSAGEGLADPAAAGLREKPLG